MASMSNIWLSHPMSRNRMDTDPINNNGELSELHQDWPEDQIFI